MVNDREERLWGRGGKGQGERRKGSGQPARAEGRMEWAEELSEEFGFEGENLGLVEIWRAMHMCEHTRAYVSCASQEPANKQSCQAPTEISAPLLVINR